MQDNTHLESSSKIGVSCFKKVIIVLPVVLESQIIFPAFNPDFNYRVSVQKYLSCLSQILSNPITHGFDSGSFNS